nr:MAG TPA: hypothetical protein [Caudoviricetes sp.]
MTFSRYSPTSNQVLFMIPLNTKNSWDTHCNYMQHRILS